MSVHISISIKNLERILKKDGFIRENETLSKIKVDDKTGFIDFSLEYD